ncbi:serpin family protein [Kitasatospora sp. NPDC006697]|uniref:serpin family protein n=1 Tax=Kitasatospora sp. NPDC006697 TaxID=3364020 RepID=UPI00369AD252
MRIRRTGLAAGAGLLAAVLATTLAGCGTTGTSGTGMLEAAAAAPEAAPTDAELTATSAGTEQFGVDLYLALAQQQNLALSPAGLAAVLGMLVPGARGATQQELTAALHTALPADRYAMALGALGAAGRKTGKGVTLKQADTVWAQRGYPVGQDYLALLSAAFRTGVRTTDFAKDPDGARKAVNQLVEQQTGGLVKDLFAPGQLSADTVLALTDALYLKADWAQPFEPKDTADADFHRLDGSTDTVRMMHQTTALRYAEGSGGITGQPWQAVELPYVGNGLAMDLVVPAQGGFDAFRKALTGPALDRILGSLAPSDVTLALPRFTVQSGEQLNQVLTGLGVRTAFGSGADFSGMVTPGSVSSPQLGAVVQKASVTVDETGTTAAAGSGGGMVATAAAPPRDVRELTVDRPFLYLIRDTATGQPLFLGQVTDPKG